MRPHPYKPISAVLFYREKAAMRARWLVVRTVVWFYVNIGPFQGVMQEKLAGAHLARQKGRDRLFPIVHFRRVSVFPPANDHFTMPCVPWAQVVDLGTFLETGEDTTEWQCDFCGRNGRLELGVGYKRKLMMEVKMSLPVPFPVSSCTI